MSHTIAFQGFVGIGIKELGPLEFQFYCSSNRTINITLANLETQNRIHFTSPISTRLINSGCYYVDPSTGFYSSFGMEILESSNLSFTHCTSNHLTQFAGGFVTLPNGIDFNDVFAHASFEQNITIYATIIVITALYVFLFIWAYHTDKQDKLKNKITTVPGNKSDDIYFYEILFHTGSGLDAGTDSVVSICLLK